MGIMKIHFGHRVGKYVPLVLNYPVTFVPGSARCSSVLCLSYRLSIGALIYGQKCLYVTLSKSLVGKNGVMVLFRSYID